VVNIDNGFGAGYQASLINQMAVRRAGEESVDELNTPKESIKAPSRQRDR